AEGVTAFGRWKMGGRSWRSACPLTEPSSRRGRLPSAKRVERPRELPYSADVAKEGCREVAIGALRLFPHREPAPVEAPQRGADRRVDHREHRGVGHPETDGPPVPGGATGRVHGAGRAQLGVAGLGDAGGVLAALGGTGKAKAPGHDID